MTDSDRSDCDNLELMLESDQLMRMALAKHDVVPIGVLEALAESLESDATELHEKAPHDMCSEHVEAKGLERAAKELRETIADYTDE